MGLIPEPMALMLPASSREQDTDSGVNTRSIVFD